MLTETVTYENFNGQTVTRDLYFNLTKTELAEMLGIEDRLEAWGKRTAGDTRDMTTEETKELLAIMKELVMRSYGEKSDDGERFRKNPDLFLAFQESPAYDAFVFSLFVNPTKAVHFMQAILPRDLGDELAKQMSAMDELNKPAPEVVSLPQVEEPTATDPTAGADSPTYNGTEVEVPAYIRENREPTKDEFRKMTQAEQAEAYRRKMQQD